MSCPIGKFLTPLFLFVLLSADSLGQKEYQSLLWEVSGNGLEEPSYLYGTMHVSDKVAFYLGEPFFEALESVDQVALELEPEEWFQDVLGGDIMSSTFRYIGSNHRMSPRNSWNEFEGRFAYPENTELQIQNIFRNSPRMINQLLFRFYDPSGNFEEETWLDMYIYQSAMKLGKKTLGLETFQESVSMMRKAQEEMADNPRSYSNVDRQSRLRAQRDMENAYRKGDLDQLDSLSKRFNDKDYNKYILIERNRKFVVGMDSLMRKAPLFTGVGAAHLPGMEGCIELLRELGYEVSPVTMGLRDAKKKDKLSAAYIKRPLKEFQSRDGLISFTSPSEVYELTIDPKATSYITMDIANGLTFMVDRFVSNNVLERKSREFQKSRLDGMLFEIIPGKILEKKSIHKGFMMGYDILHEVSRGDVNRSMILFTDQEVLIARLSGSGSKIKKGAGDHFFSSLSFNIEMNYSSPWREFNLPDVSLSVSLPGFLTDYSRIGPNLFNGDRFAVSIDRTGDVFSIHRLHINELEFIEEEKYLLDKLESAFAYDNQAIELKRRYIDYEGHNALMVEYGPNLDKRISGLYVIAGNSAVAIHCYCNVDVKIDRFLNSLSLEKEQFDSYFRHTDTLGYFSSKIPWQKSESEFDDLIGIPSMNDQDEHLYSYSHIADLTVPGSTTPLLIEYERRPRYEFGVDKAAFEQSILNELNGNNDYFLEKADFEWNGSGFIAEHLFSDSLSNYRKLVRSEMRENRLITITTGFDMNLGPSENYKAFVESLEILEDSLAHSHYFENPEIVFLEDILSRDSAYFNTANAHLTDLNSFPENARFEILEVLKDSCSILAKETNRRNYRALYNQSRYIDTSRTMLGELRSDYLNSTDSALFQREVLSTLIRMNTQEATLLAKELLLKEPPIGISVGIDDEFFSAIRDSLETAILLFPEMLELLDYKEYRDPILITLDMMLDSSLIKPEIYEDKLEYLIKQGQIELRRAKSTSYVFSPWEEEDKLPELDAFSYLRVLHPYRNIPEVDTLFQQAAFIDQVELKKAFAVFLFEQGEQLTDSAILELLGEDELRNFEFLSSIGRPELLEDSLDLNKLYIEKQIQTNWSNYSFDWDESTIDSVRCIGEKRDTIRTQSFKTYYYQSKRTTDDNSTDQVHVVLVDESSDLPVLKTLHNTDDLSRLMSIDDQLEEMKNVLISRNRRWPFRIENYQLDTEFIPF
ncbi:MAG: TraB/GumN family protein [Flavobacteriales bacterium]|nr:TraB/GumN family protein [Flavobacteriales bacterium]